MTHFQHDSSLIAAFLDRWRLETHLFHLPVGEMMVSLQDVVMLFGLPLGRPDGGYCRPQLLVTGLPRSVRERSSERSRASALPAVLGHAWSHLKLVAAVQRTCFYLIFFIFCMYLKQIEGI
jgi:hypothetical protein